MTAKEHNPSKEANKDSEVQLIIKALEEENANLKLAVESLKQKIRDMTPRGFNE